MLYSRSDVALRSNDVVVPFFLELAEEALEEEEEVLPDLLLLVLGVNVQCSS